MQKLFFQFFILFVFTLINSQSFGQIGCDEGRYTQEIFTDVVVTAGIGYGENIQPTTADPANMDSLFLDFYEPMGDTISMRPLIVWAFGGSFVFGNRTSPDIVDLCQRFSKLGYVNTSIDYRLSPELIFNGSTELGYKAVLKAAHDMKAAVRHFYKDAQTTNLYRIDTTRIFVGGVSAGGIAATHMVYLDSINEVPALIVDDLPAIGDLEGLSGNPGYSSKVKGVINFAGGIGDTAWMDMGNVPIVSAHGTEDDVIPYGTDVITLFNLNLLFHGSASIKIRMDSLGIKNDLVTFPGAGHAPFSVPPGDVPYRDSTFEFVRDFLVDLVCDETTGIFDKTLAKNLRIYPNPMSESAFIDLPETHLYEWRFLDIQGREINVLHDIDYQRIKIDRGTLKSGLYLVQLRNRHNGELWVGKLMVE